MTPLTLCLATQNRHKVDELRQLLALHAPALAVKLDIRSLAELGSDAQVDEDGTTFEANALIKARAAHRQSGLWALADDSGLEVAALDGAPGIYSARYGGEPAFGQSRDAKNRQALLSALSQIPGGQRQARFVCVLCLYGRAMPAAASMLLQRRGECRGRIEPAERGAGGFGYDALFVPDGSELQQSGLPADLADRTYAELPAEAKNRLSHRGRALRALIPSLATLAAGLPLLAD